MWILDYAVGNENCNPLSENIEIVSINLELPSDTEIITVLDYITERHMELNWQSLFNLNSTNRNPYQFRSAKDWGYLQALRRGDQMGYVFRNGTNEYDWYLNQEGEKKTTGWTPFPSTNGFQKHNQKEINSPKYGISFPGDEGISKILQYLLDNGIYTEHSCECHPLTAYPYQGLFSYINLGPFKRGSDERPNTENLRVMKATELADFLGLSNDNNEQDRFRFNSKNNVLYFDMNDESLLTIFTTKDPQDMQ
tara:strand:- start:108 stop:863 length:756 start_codon:yes stop_codon:yes gene_type:complete